MRRALTALVILATPLAAHAAGDCKALGSLKIEHATGIAAEVVEAGFKAPAGPGGAAQDTTPLPSFCRVGARLAPSADSDIAIEVWLPTANWNGKLMGVGNGGWSGAVAYPALAEALARGYAAVSTDTGHTGGSASFALGHPEKVIDFAWRAVHEMTIAAKQVVNAYYGNAALYTYWNGCSAGGRQGLQEAQRFPGDYDGIIAGAPAADWTGRAAAALRAAQAVHASDAAFLSPVQHRLLHATALESCDGRDGVVDGVIDDPQRCRVEARALACGANEGDACLTPQQIAAARILYAPAKDPSTGRELASLFPGSEPNWGIWGGAQPLQTATDHFRYVVMADAAWTYDKFDFDADIVRARRSAGAQIDALDADLSRFFGRGGRLLQYHGWADAQISPGNSLQYHERVQQGAGGAARVASSYRLFMLPGVGHCSGGDGPDSFDKITALEQWVEKGVAPERLIASRVRDGKVDRTRPLCPWPQVARYNGKGSTDAAENFSCAARR